MAHAPALPGIRRAEGVEHGTGLLADDLGRGKEHVRIEIALERNGARGRWRAGRQGQRAFQLAARARQAGRPVQPQRVALQRGGHVGQPRPAAFGEDDAGHHAPVGARAFELAQHAGRVGQAEGLEGAIGQHAAPAVKHHHGLRARVNLRVQVGGHGIGIDAQHAVHQVRAGIEHGFHLAVVVAGAAFHHVAGQRPGAARKANQRHAPGKRPAYGSHGVKHVAQPLHVGHGQAGHGGFVAHCMRKARAFARLKAQAQAHGVRHGEDV